MTEVVVKRKPPYASAGAIEVFFEKIRTLGPPFTVDSKWAQTYKLDEKLPASIPTMLRWLGVTDDKGKPSQEVWNRLRYPNTRAETLAPLVQTAYREVFEAIDVNSAPKEDLESTFVQAYQSGDVGRILTCFLTLTRYSNIETKATVGRSSQVAGSTPPKGSSRLQESRKEQPKPKPAGVGNTQNPSVSITLAIEIPSDWTEEQIANRIATVARALGSHRS